MANRNGSVRVFLEVSAGVVLCMLSAVVVTQGGLGLSGAPAQASGPAPPYDLSVLKTDSPDPVVAGNQISYGIAVTVTQTMADQAPPGDAVVLTDDVPANTTFQSLSSPGGYSCSTPPVGGTGQISCTSSSIVAGTEQFTMVVNVPASVLNGTVVTNTATVKPQLCLGPPCDDIPFNDSSTTTTNVVANAHLVFTKTASPDLVHAYTPLTYTLTVTNTGPSDAQDVKITDTLPSASAFIYATPSAGGSCTTPAVGDSGPVVCTFAGATPPGGVHSVEIGVRPCKGSTSCGTITNQGVASSSTTDPQPNQNSASVATDVQPSPVPLLSPGGLFVAVLLLFGVAFLTLYGRRTARR